MGEHAKVMGVDQERALGQSPGFFDYGGYGGHRDSKPAREACHRGEQCSVDLSRQRLREEVNWTELIR